jgi:hypothetical protein
MSDRPTPGSVEGLYQQLACQRAGGRDNPPEPPRHIRVGMLTAVQNGAQFALKVPRKASRPSRSSAWIASSISHLC